MEFLVTFLGEDSVVRGKGRKDDFYDRKRRGLRRLAQVADARTGHRPTDHATRILQEVALGVTVFYMKGLHPGFSCIHICQ